MATKAIQGYEFTVTGRFDFPFDMLRYDRCWPKAEDQITAMAPHSRGSLHRETRSVRMRGLNEPTIGRWHSFGWDVSDYDRVTIHV